MNKLDFVALVTKAATTVDAILFFLYFETKKQMYEEVKLHSTIH